MSGMFRHSPLKIQGEYEVNSGHQSPLPELKESPGHRHFGEFPVLRPRGQKYRAALTTKNFVQKENFRCEIWNSKKKKTGVDYTGLCWCHHSLVFKTSWKFRYHVIGMWGSSIVPVNTGAYTWHVFPPSLLIYQMAQFAFASWNYMEGESQLCNCESAYMAATAWRAALWRLPRKGSKCGSWIHRIYSDMH